MSVRPSATAALVALAVGAAPPAAAESEAPPPGPSRTALDVRLFHPVEGPSSGPAVYYRVEQDGDDGLVLAGNYAPGLETVTMGVEIPEALRKKVRKIAWRWRARAFPTGGNECRPGYGDSAASVSAAWKRGLKWYVLRFVWSPAAPLGAVCDRKRTLFLARDTIILESGGKPGTWRTEVVDLRQTFLDHFEGGNPRADIPDLVGIGVLTDGDQTNTAAGADWADFQVEW